MSEIKLKAILFDIENTLLDSAELKKRCIEFAVDSMIESGLSLEREGAKELLWKDYSKRFHGPNVISDFLKNNNQMDEKILKAGINGYKKGWTQTIETYPQVRETLIQLKSLGLRLAIVTDAPLRNAKKILDGLNLSEYFEVIAAPKSPAEAFKRKPSATLFLEALDSLGLGPSDAAHVGDRLKRDIKGANDVGLISIHAKYGEIFSDNGFKCKADYEINAFDELLGVVHSINQKT